MNTKSSNYALISLTLFFFGFSTVAYGAGPVIRSGETVGIEAHQVLEGDFYGLGQTITISGAADHDVYALGGAVTINAPVKEDLVVLGGVVQVHGDVGDDIRVVGGEVVIANAVLHDVVVLGGTVHILSTASIGGDLLFLGGEIRVDGPIAGSVYGTGETVRIDAHVEGNVDIRAGDSFTLGDAAEVMGSVSYKSMKELVRAQGAVVEGTITHDQIVLENTSISVQPLIINLLVLIFSGLTLFFILRSRTERIVQDVFDGYGRLGLIGLGMCMALPIVALVLTVSVIGFFVGMALFLSYFVLCIIASMALPIVIGSLAQRLSKLGTDITIFTVIVGAFITTGLLLIPLIGDLLLLITFLILFGALCTRLYTFFRNS
jgi:hypothetical protein